jgi:hypothetical protein
VPLFVDETHTIAIAPDRSLAEGACNMQSGRQRNHDQPTEQVKASYRQIQRARATRQQRWKVEEERHGVLALWLALTAPPLALAPATSVAERERRRKAELSAYVLFGVLLTGVALIPYGLVNRPILLAAIVIVGSAALAGAFNRADRTTAAALLLIGAFGVALGSALVATRALDLMWMPALDFFAVPVLLAGLLLSRRAPFAVAALGVVAVAALLELKPRDPALAHMVAQLGIYHFMVPPVTLMVVVAIASWLWARSVDHAIIRADRAEEIAAMEHDLADQKRQMERGIQSLLETHVRVANGDFRARAATGQENVLWQIAVSLNNLLSRMSKLAQADQRLQRTEAEIDRLATALEETRAGRSTAWPRSGGTRVDHLLRLLSSTQHQRLPAPSAPPLTDQPSTTEPVEVPEGVPGGKIPPWDGSGLTPITGVWRAESGHYSTARDTLAGYGSGALPAAHPSVPSQHDPLESLRESWPMPPSTLRGPSAPNQDVAPRPLSRESREQENTDRLESVPASANQPSAAHDQAYPLVPQAHALHHSAPPPVTRWPSGPLPPLPPSPWVMPEPVERAAPARSEPVPALRWRIVGDPDAADAKLEAGGSTDTASAADEPPADSQQSAAQSDQDRWNRITSLRASLDKPM